MIVLTGNWILFQVLLFFNVYFPLMISVNVFSRIFNCLNCHYLKGSLQDEEKLVAFSD